MVLDIVASRCASCVLDKAAAEFYRYPSGRLDCYCRDCRRLMDRIREANQTPARAAKRRRAQNLSRQTAQRIKTSAACLDCLEVHPYFVMDFDHIENKRLAISSMIGSYSHIAIIEEAAKCEAVCANCHRLRTFLRRKDASAPAGAARLGKKRQTKFAEDWLPAEPLSGKTKPCRTCKRDLPVESYRRRHNSDLRLSECVFCVAEYMATWHQNMGSDLRLALSEKRDLRRHQITERVKRYKEDRGCQDCLRAFPHFVLDLDHVRGIKTMEVSRLASAGYSWEKIAEELSKCEVVCANCHRYRTAKRAGLQLRSN
jgi:hypothetical protein